MADVGLIRLQVEETKKQKAIFTLEEKLDNMEKELKRKTELFNAVNGEIVAVNASYQLVSKNCETKRRQLKEVKDQVSGVEEEIQRMKSVWSDKKNQLHSMRAKRVDVDVGPDLLSKQQIWNR